jgi:hypothetical protein
VIYFLVTTFDKFDLFRFHCVTEIVCYLTCNIYIFLIAGRYILRVDKGLIPPKASNAANLTIKDIVSDVE